MIRTSKRVLGDIMMILEVGDWSVLNGGGLYYDGLRPEGSMLEDFVIKFVSGQIADSQTGEVEFNVYVPDIQMAGSGQMVENWERCLDMESFCQGLATHMNRLCRMNNLQYHFEQQETINTIKSEDRDEHIVVAKLHYKILDLD